MKKKPKIAVEVGIMRLSDLQPKPGCCHELKRVSLWWGACNNPLPAGRQICERCEAER